MRSIVHYIKTDLKFNVEREKKSVISHADFALLLLSHLLPESCCVKAIPDKQCKE